MSTSFTFDDSKSFIENAQELIKCIPMRQITVSSLQRYLRVGYPTAARLMDELEAQGLVGPLHTWERAPIDLDANWICSACGKLDMAESPDPSRTCSGSISAKIAAEIEEAGK